MLGTKYAKLLLYMASGGDGNALIYEQLTAFRVYPFLVSLPQDELNTRLPHTTRRQANKDPGDIQATFRQRLRRLAAFESVNVAPKCLAGTAPFKQ